MEIFFLFLLHSSYYYTYYTVTQGTAVYHEKPATLSNKLSTILLHWIWGSSDSDFQMIFQLLFIMKIYKIAQQKRAIVVFFTIHLVCLCLSELLVK